MDGAWVRRQFQLNNLIGAPTTADRVVSLVLLINQAYVQNGYINTGLLIGRQDWASQGAVLQLKLVAGRVTPSATGGRSIGVAWAKGGSQGLREHYIRDRMPSAAETPLNSSDLERDFRLLADDPAIRAVNAQLTPGAQAGEANLLLTVAPQPMFRLYTTVANSRNPSVGAVRYSIGGSMRNGLFSGDLLSIDAGDTGGLADAVVSYSTPLIEPRTAFDIQVSTDKAAVLDPSVRVLDVRSDETSVEGGLSERLVEEPLTPLPGGDGWSPARSFTVGMRLGWRESYTSLLGMPFSFSPGAVNGYSDLTVFRGTADFVQRSDREVIAISGTGSFGLSGSGVDLPGVLRANPHFAVILLQASYARRLVAGLEFRARFTGQWSDSTLYAMEQLSVGGADTVRGYRENLLLADRGLIGSVELGCPVTVGGQICGTGPDDWKTLRLAVFTDGAYVNNRAGPQPAPPGIASVGVSATWTPSPAFFARLTYGYALIRAAPAPLDLEDRGLEFLVTLHPLALLHRPL
jgi:hemolysin activation/secretion protein